VRYPFGPSVDVSFLKLASQSPLYLIFPAPYTPNEAIVNRLPLLLCSQLIRGLLLLCVSATLPARAQEPPSSPAQPAAKSPEHSEKTPELPAQIELLETHVRFEANGDSRKEVHTRVHINNELGARQFARLAFDYNRSFQQIEFPLVRVTHTGGGTVDILPSAISDQPNSAVVNAPAYHDVRVKSVRILGLAPGDILEYRIITTISHHPLAPDFWFSHSFDRTGIVSQEFFEVDLPASRVEGSDVAKENPALHVNPATPVTSKEIVGEGDSARVVYRWERRASSEGQSRAGNAESSIPDVAFSSFSWERISVKLAEKLLLGAVPLENLSTEAKQQDLSRKRDVTAEVKAKAINLTKEAKTDQEKLRVIYDFVSQKITTIDLGIGSTGFAVRPSAEVLSSGYATPEDKYVLFSALASSLNLQAGAALTGYCNPREPALPTVFTHLIIAAGTDKVHFWLDPSLEVAPFGVISAVPKSCAFILNRQFFTADSTGHEWETIHPRQPFPGFQKVSVAATLTSEGTLTSKVHYTLRGDNELLLRVAFHQAPKEKWREVAQLLALSDGFRGKVTNVVASDPYATKEPFTVEYEITQPKFVDWSKKPVRIPALLPQAGLPDPPATSASGAATSVIDLGTPLDVETHLTLHLPAGTVARTPTGTSVVRDYATFTSKYQATGSSVTATRHLNFLLRQIAPNRAADYNAFVRAVQNDEAQEFLLEHPGVPLPAKSADPTAPIPRVQRHESPDWRGPKSLSPSPQPSNR
jgi:hypothetical protein